MLDEISRASNMLVTVTFWMVHLVTLFLRYQTHHAHAHAQGPDNYRFTGTIRVTDVS
jgi:hypothetical protein